MKKLWPLLSFIFISCGPVLSHAGPYFNTLFNDPTHPKISAGILYVPRTFAWDGATTDVALIWHKADAEESWIPQRLLDMGVLPMSWTLLELGAGGNTETGFITAGASVNMGPTVLGPLAAVLADKGYPEASKLITAYNGSGVKLGIDWKAMVIQNSGLPHPNQLRFPIRYSLGYCYQF